jgi:hypothetical protein
MKKPAEGGLWRERIIVSLDTYAASSSNGGR